MIMVYVPLLVGVRHGAVSRSVTTVWIHTSVNMSATISIYCCEIGSANSVDVNSENGSLFIVY